MKYSFVIPTYNNCENVIKALVCITQIDPVFSYEIIVVDDGSSDDTYHFVRAYKADIDIRIFRIKRSVESCRAKARNVGWKNAKGKFIVFVDSDILVKSNYLKELNRYFSYNENALILGCRLHVQEKVEKNDVLNGRVFKDNLFVKNFYDNLDYRYLVFSAESFNGGAISDPWLHAYSCNFSIKKEWLIKVNGFDENIREWGLEDIELAYRLYRAGVKILINPYLDVLHQNSFEHRDDIKIRKERMVGYERNINYFLQKHPAALIDYEDPFRLLVYGKNYVSHKNSENVIEFFESDNVQEKKEQVLSFLYGHEGQLLFNDYVDDSGFDCWVQNLPVVDSRILYFPISKKVDVYEMFQHIESKRN